MHQGLLRYTYRGHSAEVADVTVSYCNQMIASGSVDKSIRLVHHYCYEYPVHSSIKFFQVHFVLKIYHFLIRHFLRSAEKIQFFILRQETSQAASSSVYLAGSFRFFLPEGQTHKFALCTACLAEECNNIPYPGLSFYHTPFGWYWILVFGVLDGILDFSPAENILWNKGDSAI